LVVRIDDTNPVRSLIGGLRGTWGLFFGWLFWWHGGAYN